MKGQRIGVVGLGTIGTQEIELWERAGYPVVGYDISAARVQALTAANKAERRQETRLTTDFGDLAECDAIIVCLPNLGPSGELSLAAFDSFARELQALPSAERLVIIASTVPIGFTHSFASRSEARGVLVAHAPERFDPGRGTELGEINRVIGATSAKALKLASDLYIKAGVPIHQVDPVEVAEASKLLENAFRLVNIAFINEFAELCRRMGIVAADVIDAAATKPFAFMAHKPGVGAGGTCIPTMPLYLLEAAKRIQLDMPILKDAVAGNDKTVEHVAGHLGELLKSGGITRGRILVVGATYKPNYPDARGSAALRFSRGLAAHHDVVVYDPIVDATGLAEDVQLIRNLPRDENFDAIVIAVKHRDTDAAALRLLSPILIDLVRGSVEVVESISSHQ